MRRNPSQRQTAASTGRGRSLRHDGRTLRCVVVPPEEGDSVWSAILEDPTSGILCQLTGWIATFPKGLGPRLGLRNHLRLVRARTLRSLSGRGYAQRLLREACRVFDLPVEPESMWDAIERYPRWDWLESNRGALSAEALLSPIPASEGTPSRRRRGTRG